MILSTALQPGLMGTAGTDTPWARLWVVSGAPFQALAPSLAVLGGLQDQEGWVPVFRPGRM